VRSILAAGCLLVAHLAATAHAQQVPDPLRVVVPLSAGSTLDARARVLADALGRQLGQRVIVENRPGAGGTIGARFVAQARPDGGTLLFNNNSHTISPALYDSPGYDPLADFVPVVRAYGTGMVLVVHPRLGVNSLGDLVALARDPARKPPYASSGNGSLPHFAMELFKRSAGISLVHVPYRGDAQALTDLLGGQSPVMLSGYVAALPHVKAGRLRALAVTSARRTDVFPGVPTIAESGYPDYAIDAWGAFFLPARTPQPVVDRLRSALAAAIASPAVREHYAATGAVALDETPAQLAALLRDESLRFGRLVRELGLKAE
jgi:tripartite-type tricarboxylate transporter receptor subunit TctC